MSSFREDSPISSVSHVASTHLERLREPEPSDDVEMGDEYLLSMRPYRPLDAPSTPASNSPLSSPPLQQSRGTSDPRVAGPLSPRGTSPDVTSSPSELSRRIGGTSSHTSARSPSPTSDVRRLLLPQSELVNPEPRPGPEDAEGSTRRWSFRSRKANQLQPYRFDRLQYKRQLQGNPDAVVTMLSPHRRRPSPRSTLDRDFIADGDGENTQDTSEFPGPALTEEEESESQSRDSHNPRWNIPSPGPPAQPPPQWYLDEMEQISDTDSDDDGVVEYLAGRSRKKQSAAEPNNNGEALAVSHM